MKLGILGAIGVDDLGDIVLLQENIRKLGNEIEFTVFTQDASKTRYQLEELFEDFSIEIIEVPKLENVNHDDLIGESSDYLNEKLYFKYKNIYKDYIKCDALYFIGGGYFNKYWEKKMEVYFELPIRLFSYLNKPIYISSVTIGPFDNETYKIKYGLFKNCHTICLRDHIQSFRNLKKFGNTNGKVLLNMDDILISNSAIEKKSSERYVVLQQFFWVEEFAENIDEYYKIIATFLDYLIDNLFIDKIYYIPFNNFRNGVKGGDYLYGEKILKNYIKNKESFILYKPFSSYQKLRKVIRRALFVLANRYHPLVFAHGEYTPAIGLYVNDLYKQKLQGVYEVSNLDPESHTFNINELKVEDLINWFNQYILNEKYEINYEDLYNTYSVQKRNSIDSFIKDVLFNKEK